MTGYRLGNPSPRKTPPDQEGFFLRLVAQAEFAGEGVHDGGGGIHIAFPPMGGVVIVDEAGAAEAALIRSDAAAAIGAGLDLNSPEAKLVVDVGAGKITATLFTLGRVAAEASLPYGLGRIDERVQRITRTGSGFRIGLSSAREIKHTLGTALPEAAPEDIIMRMTGFSLERRQPETFDVETRPVIHACEEVVSEIALLCSGVVTEAPEELSADLNDSGITLVGGGAELAGLDKRLGDTLGIPCRIADAPSKCAVRGLFAIMQEPEKYEAAFMRRSRRGNVR